MNKNLSTDELNEIDTFIRNTRLEDESIRDLLEKVYCLGIDRVIEYRSEYGLFDKYDREEAYDKGKDDVLDNPEKYGYYTKDDIEDLKKDWIIEHETW